jgi:hypothetical protein
MAELRSVNKPVDFSSDINPHGFNYGWYMQKGIINENRFIKMAYPLLSQSRDSKVDEEEN